MHNLSVTTIMSNQLQIAREQRKRQAEARRKADIEAQRRSALAVQEIQQKLAALNLLEKQNQLASTFNQRNQAAPAPVQPAPAPAQTIVIQTNPVPIYPAPVPVQAEPEQAEFELYPDQSKDVQALIESIQAAPIEPTTIAAPIYPIPVIPNPDQPDQPAPAAVEPEQPDPAPFNLQYKKLDPKLVKADNFVESVLQSYTFDDIYAALVGFLTDQDPKQVQDIRKEAYEALQAIEASRKQEITDYIQFVFTIAGQIRPKGKDFFRKVLEMTNTILGKQFESHYDLVEFCISLYYNVIYPTFRKRSLDHLLDLYTGDKQYNQYEKCCRDDDLKGLQGLIHKSFPYDDTNLFNIALMNHSLAVIRYLTEIECSIDPVIAVFFAIIGDCFDFIKNELWKYSEVKAFCTSHVGLSTMTIFHRNKMIDWVSSIFEINFEFVEDAVLGYNYKALQVSIENDKEEKEDYYKDHVRYVDFYNYPATNYILSL